MELFREDVVIATMEKAGKIIQEDEDDEIPRLGRRNLGDVTRSTGGRLAAARPLLL